MDVSLVLLVPLLVSQARRWSKRRLAILAVAVLVPLAVFGSLYALVSSVGASARIISIRVVGSEEGTLLLEAEVALSSTAPVDVRLEEAVASLYAHGSKIGEAELVEPVVLPVGREANATVRARVWDAQALARLISDALSAREARLEAKVRGRAQALFFPVWFERTIGLDVPLPRVELGELAQLVNVSPSSTPLHADVLLRFRNPTDVPFELRQLDFSLKMCGAGGELYEEPLASVSLLNAPYEFGPGGQVELLLDVAFHDGEAVEAAVAGLLEEGAFLGEAVGEAIVGVAGVELAIGPLELALNVDAPLEISARPLDVRVNGSDVLATVEVGVRAGPFSGPIWAHSCVASLYLCGPEGEEAPTGYVGSLELPGPALLQVGGESVLEVLLKPTQAGVEQLADALTKGGSLRLSLLDVDARISVLGAGPLDVSASGPIPSLVDASLSYDVSLRVLDLWPVEPGDVFKVMAQLNITLSSPVSSPLSIASASFELYNTTGFYLGNGSLDNSIALPSANGTFSLRVNSTFHIYEWAIGWVVQELLDEGSLELLLRSVRAEVRVGSFSLGVEVPDLRYAYSPGEVGFEVTDVRLVEFDADRGVVVFDIDISIYNPFGFAVNLSWGPGGGPPLSFEFWCQEHYKFLGYGRYEQETTLFPRAETHLTVRVDLTPEGAWHVITEHYNPWPPPGRIRMLAAVRNGVAFVRIYEVVVRVRFEEEGIQVDEPVSPGSLGPSVYACLEEIGHLHEGPPGLRAPEPFYGPLGLLRQPLHEPPRLLQGARLNEYGAYFLELAGAYVRRVEELEEPPPEGLGPLG